MMINFLGLQLLLLVINLAHVRDQWVYSILLISGLYNMFLSYIQDNIVI